MAPAEAEGKARVDFGFADVLGEKCRDAVGLRTWDEIWSDLRYGLPGLWRNPGFAAVTIPLAWRRRCSRLCTRFCGRISLRGRRSGGIEGLAQ